MVLAKWVATQPRILILDEPTQGIDVQPKAAVHAMISYLASEGLAIILISSEMPELLGMCARIVVLNEGRQAATFDREDATAETVLDAATQSLRHEDTEASGAAAPADTVTPTQTESLPAQTLWSQTLRKILVRRELGLLVAILVVMIPVTILNPRMISGSNMYSLTMDAALLGRVALGQMLVILTRNIDLSVASVIGLTAYASAALMSANPEFPALAGVAFACALGAGFGAINGVIIAFGQVPSMLQRLVRCPFSAVCIRSMRRAIRLAPTKSRSTGLRWRAPRCWVCL